MNLVMLETFTANMAPDMPLPDFLTIEREVTDDPNFSMYNLSRRTSREPSPRHRHGSADETSGRAVSKPIPVINSKRLSDVERFNGLSNGLRKGSAS